MFTHQLPARVDALEELILRLMHYLSSHAVPEHVRHHVTLIAEELFVNIAEYAGSSDIRVQIDISIEPTGVRVWVYDNGPMFNPLEALSPDLSSPLAERRVGGLGIYLAHKLSDGTMTYAWQHGRNLVTLFVAFAPI